MRDIPVSELMSKPLVAVSPTDTLRSAAALMEQRSVHHLLVLDEGKLAGILSSADLLKVALLERPEPGSSAAVESLGILVRDVMQSRVAVVRSNTGLREIAHSLSLGGFHALPVLAVDGTPVGIVTSSDLIAVLVDHIDRAAARDNGDKLPVEDSTFPVRPLLDALKAAEIYLHSGASSQQHARLSLAVSRARESIDQHQSNAH